MNTIRPSYYTKAKNKECIEEMRERYGDYAVKCFCLCNAYKYHYRAGLKEGNSKEQDLSKAEWYLNYAKSLDDTKRCTILQSLRIWKRWCAKCK